MGAWIETALWGAGDVNHGRLLPLWEHGLKPSTWSISLAPAIVAPFMGAWIETTLILAKKAGNSSCSLYGSMD